MLQRSPAGATGQASVAVGLPAADIAVDISAPPVVLLPGSLDFTLTAENLGPSTAASVTFGMAIPSGVDVTGLSSGCAQNGTSVECTVNNLSSGFNVSQEVQVTPASVIGAGTVTATMTSILSTPVDPSPANNTDSVTCTYVTILLATC